MNIFNKNNITVFQSAVFKMNSTVAVTNDLVLIVDPGYLPNEMNQIQEFVENVKKNKPVYLFFTHSDFDHIVGYGAFPAAITIASKEFVESSLKNKQLADMKSFDDDLYIDRKYKLEYPKIHHIIDADGQEMKIGDTRIKFYHGFGHTDDGLFAVVENNNLLLAGDYLSDLEFPFVYNSFQKYERTLHSFKRVIQERSNLILVPGHGSITEGRENINFRIKQSEDYFLLLKKATSDNDFRSFLLENGYKYQSNLLKRHQENLMIWNKQHG